MVKTRGLRRKIIKWLAGHYRNIVTDPEVRGYVKKAFPQMSFGEAIEKIVVILIAPYVDPLGPETPQAILYGETCSNDWLTRDILLSAWKRAKTFTIPENIFNLSEDSFVKIFGTPYLLYVIAESVNERGILELAKVIEEKARNYFRHLYRLYHSPNSNYWI